MFFTLFGYWVRWAGGGGSRNGVVHSKNDFSEIYFFDVVTTHNDQPSYVKHVLGSVYVFFTLFGDWLWGGVTQWSGTQPAYAIFHPVQLKN